jgi:hypothetical protein
MIPNGFWDWSLRDSFDWFGLLVGLVLTVLAILQAKGAKEAALDAKNSVWKRDASDSFRGLAELAVRLAFSVRNQRVQGSAIFAGLLVENLPQEVARFKQHITANSDKQLHLRRDRKYFGFAPCGPPCGRNHEHQQPVELRHFEIYLVQ